MGIKKLDAGIVGCDTPNERRGQQAAAAGVHSRMALTRGLDWHTRSKIARLSRSRLSRSDAGMPTLLIPSCR